MCTEGVVAFNLRNSGQDWLPSFPTSFLDTVVYRVGRYAASELWRRGWPEGPIIEGACLLDARRAPRAGYGMGAKGYRYQTSWSQRREVNMGLPKLSLLSWTVEQPCRDYDKFLLWGAYSGNACGCNCGGRIHADDTKATESVFGPDPAISEEQVQAGFWLWRLWLYESM